jgi:hypothetical protein
MRKHALFGVILACGVAALAGCGRGNHANSSSSPASSSSAAAPDSSKLSGADVSNLILQYERQNCAWNTYSYPYADYQQIMNFFAEQVRLGRITAGQTGAGMGSNAQNFPYTDHYGDNQLAQYWWEPPYEVRVKDCMYLPTGIQILDTTYDATGKGAQVIFRNAGSEPTDFGKHFIDLMGNTSDQHMWMGASKDMNTLRIDNTELVATLQKLDATGWRVDTILQSVHP